MVTLNVSGALSTAWEFAKKHGLIIAAVLLVWQIVSNSATNFAGSLFGGSTLSSEDAQRIGEEIARGNMEALSQLSAAYSNVGSSLMNTITSFVAIILSTAIYNLCLGLMSGRFSSPSFDAFKLEPMTYLKVFVVELITGIIVVVSFLCCIIPFFFVVPRVILAPLYQIDHPEAGIMESIKAGWNMSSGNTMPLLGLGILCFGISILGLFCCCIGVFFAEAIEYFAVCAAYYQLKQNVQ